MAYDDTQLKIDLDHITSLPQWQDEAKRRDFAREVAIAARQEQDPDVGRKFIPALWAAADGGMLDKAGNFVKRGVEEVLKSGPAGGGAVAFAAGDAVGLTDSGSGTRFKRGVAELADGTGQRLKQLGGGEFMGMNLLPGQSKQKVLADTLSELKKDLDTGASPEGLNRWLAGEHDDGSAPDEETGKWVGYLTQGLAKMAVEADHMGDATSEKVRSWMESDRNPAYKDSDTPGDPGPRELLADYVATGDPQSWSAFESRVRETDAQRTTRLQRYANESQARQVAAAMPDGVMKDLTQRSFDMQTSPIDLATSVLPMLRGAAALKAAKAGAKGGSVAAQVLTGGLKEAAQEAGTEYLGNPNASTAQVLEAGALGAVGSVALEGTMGAVGSGIRRVTVGPQTAAAANGSAPSTPPPDAATGGNVLAQIAARGGRVDAPLETDPSAPIPDAGTGAIDQATPLQTQPRSAQPAAYPSVFDVAPIATTNPDTTAPPAVHPAVAGPAAEAGSQTASVSAAAPGATLPSATAPTPAAVTRLPTGQDQVSTPVETGLPATPTPDAAQLRSTAPTPAATPQEVSASRESGTVPGSDAAAALPTAPPAPPTSPSQATASDPRPAAESVTRTRAAERVLTTQGVDLETAAVLAARLSETLPADMPLEQLRERVLAEFEAAGGTLPGSVPKRYVEDARAYEGTGSSPQEAAMHAANAKAANDQDVSAAHAKNRQLREALSRPRVKMSKPGQTTRQRLSSWWKGYAQNLLRSHKRGEASSKTDLLEIAADYAVPGEMGGIEIDPSAYPKTARAWLMSFKDDAGGVLNAYIHQSRDGFVHVDTQGMRGKTKARGGDLVYQTALTFAHNNGLRFRPDPDGVSAIAKQRRLGHLLSSALRHGTTRHIDPSHKQAAFQDVDPDYWRKGDSPEAFADNVAHLAEMESLGVLNEAKKRGVNIAGLHYDAESDSLLDDSGRTLRNRDLADTLARLDSANSGVGETALLRAVVTEASMRLDGSGGRALLDDSYHDLGTGESATNRSGSGLLERRPDEPYRVFGTGKKLLYSRPSARAGSSLSPQSRAKLAQSGVNLLRQNSPEIAQGIRLVTNRDALNEADFHPDDWAGMTETEGFFDPRTGQTVIFTDQVEIREGETMPRAIARVAIHERLGHAGLETLRQSDPTFAKRWAAIVESIETDPTLSAEVAAIAEQPGYEHLAGDPNGLVEEWFARRVEALNDKDLAALKPTAALGKLWQALKDLLNRWTRNFSRAEWTARELREVMALSKQALHDGGPVGVESDGRVKQARKLNPFHGSGLPNWLKKPFSVPANAPFRVQNLGLRALLKGSALPSELLPFARQSERDIAAIRQTSAQISQDLNESLTAYAAKSGKTLEEVHELAAKAMEDPVILQALPDPVMKERVRRARNLLDDLSAAVGKFAGGDLGAAILKNRGHWMRRSYACFDEAANWTYDSLTKAASKGEKINGVLASKVLKDARDYVTRNVTAQRAAAKEPAPKPGEIEAIMRQLTDRNVWEKSLLGNLQGSGVSKDVTSLMHRAAYHPDVAAWMKRNAITDWDYQTVASLAATGGNWQGRNAAVTLAAARASLALLHPKATAAEINDMLRQQDIAAPLRALMGEEVNPVKRFLSSSSFQAQYIARHEQQVAMRDLGLQMGLFSMQQTGVFTEELGDGRERNGFQVEVPQKTPNGQTVMVRKAIYATPETMAALRMSQGSANPADLGGRLVEALKFIGSEAKLNKVALNPDSWMVNALGNFMGLIQSGDLLSVQGWSNVARAIELHRSGKAKSGDAVDAAAEAIQDKRRELLARLTAAGVANSGLEMSDVEAALDNRVTQFINEHDAWNTVTGGVRGAILGNGLGRPFGWMGQAAGAVVGGVAGAKLGSETIQKAQRKIAEWTTGNPDRFAKLAAFYSNYETHLAAGMAEADAFALATEKTMNTLPDYSKLPDLMRQLSRLGLMGSFIGFQYEVYRNAYWNARYSIAEIKSGNPALVARGTRRMIGLSSMMTLAAFGLSGMIRGMFGAGVDDDKDKAYRRALGAEHERFGTLAYTKLDEDGASFFNTSYLLPQVTLFEVIKAGIEGRDLGESLSNTAKQLTDQFVSGSVHLDPLIAAWTNQRPIGGKVTYEEGPRGMADRVLYFLYVTMEPGALNKEDRIVRALQERGRYGRQFSLDEELKRFLGVRQNTYTHEERIKSRLFRFRDSYDDARSLARTAYRQGDPNALDTLARANERIGKLQGEWEQFQADLQTIGLPTNKFEQIRKAVGTAREFPLLIMGESGPESERVKTPKAYRADVEATEDNKARGQVKTR